MIHSFLLIGQSNMAGRGVLTEVEPIKDTGIKMLRNGRWQVMTEPVNYDRPFSGVGLSASFAMAWRRQHPDAEIGLIPCADGGSMLDEWMPGEALFDHAVFQAKLAKRVSRIDGILWHQGETDCPMERAEKYGEKFATIVTALRQELELPDVPLIIGGLGEFLPQCPIHDYFVNAPYVDKKLQEFARTHENCWYVTAKGLKSNPDILHFNAISQRIFGIRYYEAWEQHADVCEPLADESDLLDQSGLKTDQSENINEKLAQCKKELEAGSISPSEYNRRVEAIVSSL